MKKCRGKRGTPVFRTDRNGSRTQRVRAPGASREPLSVAVVMGARRAPVSPAMLPIPAPTTPKAAPNSSAPWPAESEKLPSSETAPCITIFWE